MRIKVVFHYLGILIGILGLSMLFPLACSIYYQESDLLVFVISIAITLVSGLLLWKLFPVSEERLSQREAIMLVSGGWILASAFGTLPYVLAGIFPSYLDAYFEAISGFTTTGATVLTDIDSLRISHHGILIWRSLTQWIGGMGIITLFVALFPVLGIGASFLVDAEMPGPQAERITARIRDTAKALWLVYFGFSGLEVITLWIAGMPLFDAFSVTLSTMPTGGFTPTTLSVGAYNSVLIEGIIIFFMVLAGVNFALYYFLFWKHQPKRILSNPEFQFYILILTGSTIFMALNLINDMGLPVSEAFRYSSFQSVSIMTTTGFVTVNFDVWPAFSKVIMLCLMAIGASAGSTGGAIKITRIMVLLKYAYRRIILFFNPRVVLPIKIGKNIVPEGIISEIVGMSILYFGILVFGFILMSTVGLDQVSALSSVAATLGNVGPGLGLVGPAANYLFIPALGKIILIVCMLVGRLELFTVLVLLTPSFWKWR
ncbi:MAG: TrkH family potassium uptake protein [Dehalococcoidales bacterium]|nr:TrkH family potassium uptake protein [Dehalococcoidales bacterium]